MYIHNEVQDVHGKAMTSGVPDANMKWIDTLSTEMVPIYIQNDVPDVH